jgi:hypothetical protein
VDNYYGFLRYASEWLSHKATDVILLSLQTCDLVSSSFLLVLPFFWMTCFLLIRLFAETILFTHPCDLADGNVMPLPRGHCISPI